MTKPNTDERRAAGMSGITMMPFPLLNPWNWGALTPMRGVATGLVLLRCSLSAWRSGADAAIALLRHQQDATLDAMQREVNDAARGPADASEQVAPSAKARRRTRRKPADNFAR